MFIFFEQGHDALMNINKFYLHQMSHQATTEWGDGSTATRNKNDGSDVPS